VASIVCAVSRLLTHIYIYIYMYIYIYHSNTCHSSHTARRTPPTNASLRTPDRQAVNFVADRRSSHAGQSPTRRRLTVETITSSVTADRTTYQINKSINSSNIYIYIYIYIYIMVMPTRRPVTQQTSTNSSCRAAYGVRTASSTSTHPVDQSSISRPSLASHPDRELLAYHDVA